MDPHDTLLVLALCRMSSLRPRERIRVASCVRQARDLERLSCSELEGIVGRRLRAFSPRALLDQAEADERSLTRNRIGCIFFFDPRYPNRLREIFDPPLALFYRGRLPSPEGTTVAVVGTRKPTAAARRAAREVGRTLAAAGVCVVSGLALGIDGEAHRGAVQEGGSHVAVLGCGLSEILPACNAPIGRKLLSLGGTLLSEQPPDEPPRKQHFPARNRLISGLSRAVVIVQAPARSGALITADFALEQGRDVLVHADGLGGAAGAGGAALADSGARVIADGAAVLAEMGIPAPRPREAEGALSVGQRIARTLERELDESRDQETTRSDREWR